MKAHTDQVNLHSLLNAEADHYASKAQVVVNSLHLALIPTFFMDNYTFYQPKDGWIELNIRRFIEFFVAQSTSLKLQNGHHY